MGDSDEFSNGPELIELLSIELLLVELLFIELLLVESLLIELLLVELLFIELLLIELLFCADAKRRATNRTTYIQINSFVSPLMPISFPMLV